MMNIPEKYLKKLHSQTTITAIDSHTAGDVTRLVVEGIPEIPGNTMQEKKEWLEDHGSFYRNFLMREPRGFSDMEGVILTQPAHKKAHLGAIFMSPKYFWDMCGTGIIGLTVSLFELGLFNLDSKEAIHIDTPAGIVTVVPKIENQHLKEVSFTSVPAFFDNTFEIILPPFGKLAIDIVYGGGFYGIIPLKHLALTFDRGNIPKYIELSDQLVQALKKQHHIKHFTHPSGWKESIDSLTIRLVQELEHQDHSITIPPEHTVYRSPCGTGSCAHHAWKFHYGKINPEQPLVHRSLIGSQLKTRMIKTLDFYDKKAIIPEVTGSAWITGIHHFILDAKDPFREGFEISG